MHHITTKQENLIMILVAITILQFGFISWLLAIILS